MSVPTDCCPRCDRPECPAAGFTGPGSVARARGWEPGRPACEGEPVDWRARALEAGSERSVGARLLARATDRQRDMESEIRRLREALASLIESYDLAMGPESPLPPPVKDVVRGCFWDAGDARAALAAAKGGTT